MQAAAMAARSLFREPLWFRRQTPTPGQPPMNVRTKGANVPIQISTAVEHFNRMRRMIDAGEKVTMTVDLAVEFQDQDPNGYNTVAEIPGTDRS